MAPVPVAVPDAEAEAPDPDAEAPDVAVVFEAERIVVMVPDIETTTVELPYGIVFKPVLRPAGMVATIGWEVMTEGWVVIATPPAGWEVWTDGIPVMTPLEFVWVRYWVFGFEYGGVETEVVDAAEDVAAAELSCAETAAAKAAATRTEYCILRLV